MDESRNRRLSHVMSANETVIIRLGNAYVEVTLLPRSAGEQRARLVFERSEDVEIELSAENERDE